MHIRPSRGLPEDSLKHLPWP